MQNPLKCYIDFKVPASYLALKPTIQLIQDYGLTPRWLPYPCRPSPSTSSITTNSGAAQASENETRGETHRRIRAVAQQKTHALYAKAQQTTMNFPAEPGESRLALAAMLNVEHNMLEFIQAAYKAYWEDQEDLNSPMVVTRLLVDTNNDPKGLSESYLDQLDTHQLNCEESGIMDAPTFCINEHIFVGREHFPWIRQELDDS